MSDIFRDSLLLSVDALSRQVATERDEWTVKGFIDIYQQIYTISLDTKVLSKVLELVMFPVLVQFAEQHEYDIVLAQAQNHYPDITFISRRDRTQCFAVDIKSTYRTLIDQAGNQRVNGMTLGTFGGYFRTRDRPLTSTLAYNRYLDHYVLGVVYSRVPGIDERRVYNVSALADIPSVARDFRFFLHKKWQVASDRPGSGNTKYIGSSTYLDRLVNGTGVFSALGVEIYDDYWMNYYTRAMAREAGFTAPPYTNLRDYQVYRQQGAGILAVAPERIESEADDPLSDTSDEM
jgi:hypothetical protein